MADDNIFENKTDNSEHNINSDELLNSITNENGDPKYSSVGEALKALQHSQEHIKNLETENADLRTKTEGTAKAEALTAKLEELFARLGDKPKADQSNSNGTQQPVDIETLVQQTLEKNTKEAQRTANAGQVVAKFSEAYGDNAEKQFKQLASDTGMSIEELNELAKKSPSAVIKLAGLDKVKPASPATNHGDINTTGFQTTKPNLEKTKSIFAGGTTKDLVHEWRRVGELLKQSGE